MKKLILAVAVGLFVSACEPSAAAVETAIAKTQAAQLGSSPVPTRTPARTTPPRTPTRTMPPSPSPTFTPAPGDILFSDDFSSTVSQWSVLNDSEVGVAQSNGVLSMTIKVPNILYWSELRGNFDDVTIDVGARMVAGPLENEFGVMCRFTRNRNYQFAISSDGFYGIWLFVRDEYTTLRDWTRSPAIKTGQGQVNHITATCMGNQLSLSVNGKHLTTVSSDAYADGEVALFVGAYDESGPKVEFDNVVLTYPLESSTVMQQATQPSAPSFPGPTVVAPSATSPPGLGYLTINNMLDKGVRFDLWGPSRITVDLAARETRVLQVPTGAYGWTSFLLQTTCQLNAVDSLIVEPTNTLTVEPDSSDCGAHVLPER